jgi:hypothetical protein
MSGSIKNKLKNAQVNLEKYKREVDFYNDQLKQTTKTKSKSKKVTTSEPKKSGLSTGSKLALGATGAGLLTAAGLAYRYAKNNGYIDKLKSTLTSNQPAPQTPVIQMQSMPGTFPQSPVVSQPVPQPPVVSQPVPVGQIVLPDNGNWF